MNSGRFRPIKGCLTGLVLVFLPGLVCASGFTLNGATVTFNNGASLKLAGNFVVNSGSFTLNNSNMAVGGHWSQSGGSFQTSNSTVTFEGVEVSSISGPGSAPRFAHLRVNKTGADKQIYLWNGLDIDGNLEILDGGFDFGSTTVTVAGDYTNNSNLVYFSDLSVMIFDGSGAQTVGGAVGDAFPHIVRVNKPGGTVTIAADRNIRNLEIANGGLALGNIELVVYGDWTHAAGTFTAGPSTVTFRGSYLGNIQTITPLPGHPFTHFKVDAGTDTVVPSNGLTAAGNFSIVSGTFQAGGFAHSIAGDFRLTGGAFEAMTSTVIFNGGTDAVVNSTYPFNNLYVAKPGAALYANSDLDIDGNLTVDGSVFHPSGFSHKLAGSFKLVNAGTWSAGGGTFTFNGSGAFQDIPQGGNWSDFVVAPGALVGCSGLLTAMFDGNFTVQPGGTFDATNEQPTFRGGTFANNGTFTATGSQVTFDTSGTVNITAGAGFNVLKIGNSFGGTVALSTNVTANSLDAIKGTFDMRGATVTVNGPVTLNNAGTVVNLSSGVLNAAGGVTVGSGATLKMPPHAQAAVLRLGAPVNVNGGGFVELGSAGVLVSTMNGTYQSFNINDGTPTIQGATFRSVRLYLNGYQNLQLGNVSFTNQEAGQAAFTFDGNPGNETLNGMSFDATVSTNVYGPALSAGIITMAGATGAKTGPLYENDPNGKIFWDGFDDVGPTSVVLFPANNAVVSAVPTLSGTASDTVESGGGVLAGVSLAIRRLSDGNWWNGGGFVGASQQFVDTGALDGVFDGANETWIYTGLAGALVSGTSYFAVSRASDSLHVENPLSSGVTFYFDSVTPLTSILEPNGVFENGALTTLSGTATDAHSGLSAVQLRMFNQTGGVYWNAATQGFDIAAGSAGTAWFNAVTTTSWTNWYSTQSLTSLVSGQTYRLEARAQDLAGNFDAVTATQSFTFDSVAPLSGIEVPAHNTKRLALPVISGTLIDADSGVQSLALRIRRDSDGSFYDAAGNFVSTPTWVAASVFVSSWTYNFIQTNLTTGTTYQVVSKATDQAGNVQTSFSVGVSSNSFVYDTAPPSTASVTGLFLTSATANWSLIRGATGYTLLVSTISTNPPASANIAASSVTVGESATAAGVSGLSVNTTYYFFVRADAGGISTAYNIFAASVTLASPPSNLSFSGVHFSSMTVAWDTNAGGPTAFEAAIDDDPGFVSVLATNTFTTSSASAQTGFTSLQTFTTYYVRVRAVNHGGVPTEWISGSTRTRGASAPAGASVSAVYFSSVTANWNIADGATGYTLVASTASDNPPASVVSSSVTVGNGTTSATVDVLTPNTTYYLFVRSNFFNGSSGFSLLPATATLPTTPGIAPAVFTNVAITSFTVNWSSGTAGLFNPEGTNYLIEYTTSSYGDPGQVNVFTGPIFNPPAYTLTGLAANTTYQVRVKAVGHGGSVSGYNSIESTTTLVPAAPTGAVVTAVATTTVSAAWNIATGATGYFLAASTNPGASPNPLFASTLTIGEGNTNASVVTLLPNTTYFLFVRSEFRNGSSPYSVLSSTVTSAADPSNPAPNEINFTSATFSWNTNSGGVNTQFEASIADNAGFSPAFGTNTFSTADASTQTTFTGLTSDTTYYFRVRAFNRAGTPTSFSSVVSTMTRGIGAPPSVAVSAVTAASVTAGWSLVSGATGYTLVASTLSVNPPSTVVSSATVSGEASLSATLGSLTANTTYFLFVRSNFFGGSSGYSAVPGTATLANAPVSPTFSAVGENALTFGWSDGGNPIGTLYEAQISSDSFGPLTQAVQTTALSATFSGLTVESTFQARVKAINHGGLSSAFATVISTITQDATPPTAAILEPNSSEEKTSLSVLSGTAADAASGVKSVLLRIIDEAANQDWNGGGFAPGPIFVATSSFASGVWTYTSLPSWIHGTTYTVVAKTLDARDNVHYATRTFTADGQAPATINNLTALNTGFPGQIRLSWTVPTEDTASGLAPASFEVRYATGADFSDDAQYNLRSLSSATYVAAVVGNSYTHFVNGLTDGTTYFFHIKSVDFAGNVSPMDSSGAVFAFPGDLTGPNPVTSFTAQNTGVAGEVQLTWTVPSDAGAYPVPTLFDIAYATSPIPADLASFLAVSGHKLVNVSTPSTPVGSQLATTVTGLTVGQTYIFRIRGRDAALNYSDQDSVGPFLTVSGDALAPAAISALRAVSGSAEGSVSLTWTVPAEDNGVSGSGAPQNYDIRYATFAFGSTVFSSLASRTVSNGTATEGAEVTTTLTGLSPGTTYFFRIKSQDEANNVSVIDLTTPQASALATSAAPTVIQGTVRQSNGQAVNLVLAEAIDASGAVAASAFSNSSGAWRVEGLASASLYTIRLSWTANEVTSSIFLENIPTGTSNLDFTLEIAYELASISGSVALSARAAAAGTYGTSAAGSESGYVEIYQNGRKAGVVNTDGQGKYVIPNLLPGHYTLRAYNGLGFSEFVDVSVAEGQTLSLVFAFDLLPEDKVYFYPNPARDHTVVRFESAAHPLEAQAYVFDLTGALVRELPGLISTRSGAEISWQWDLRNDRGEAVASGVYLVEVKVHDPVTGRRAKVVKKLAVIR